MLKNYRIMKSTSIHTINADKRPRQRVFWYLKLCFWYLFNWLNNKILPNLTDRSVIIRDFITDISDENWRTLKNDTPSRMLCDIFWLQLPWEAIQAELGQIVVFDSGCGLGNYGEKLVSDSKGRISRYFGIDKSKQDNWRVMTERFPNFHFSELQSSDLLSYVPEDVNFFMSQSAIEHFEQDIYFFEQIRNFTKRTSKPIIQVHIFPSAACYLLFLHHGVRQYTPRTISKITSLFKDNSYSILYGLGGKECNRLHWEFITKSSLTNFLHHKQGYILDNLNDDQAREYDHLLRQAIVADNNNPNREPSFYALVIHSNYRKMIF